MPKREGQKLKLHYLREILLKETDNEHGLTAAELMEKLREYGISVERRTLYNDIEMLKSTGIEISTERIGREQKYSVTYKPFELPELKLLVDAVQSSKFITEKKSKELIEKLTELGSRYEANQIKRQVEYSGRVKSENSSIMYNVDGIHKAIADNKKISFEYLRWNINKTLEPKRNVPYEVSPWALTWADENYYLIGCMDNGEIRHYRVDKIKNVKVLNEKRSGKDVFRNFNIAEYNKGLFRMFAGEEREVRLRLKNNLAGVLIDEFGKDIKLKPHSDDELEAIIRVSVSNMFFGWIFGLGEDIRIVSPEDVVGRYKECVERIQKEYK